MEKSDLEKYILEQAKIEIEHTRSWPTKVMAFYVAINFGVVGFLLSLKQGNCCFSLPSWSKHLLGLLLFSFSLWVAIILGKNHLNYLSYRNLQVRFQAENLASFREKYKLPDEWFNTNEVNILRRFWGWGLYLFIVVIVTTLVLYSLGFVV